MDSIRRIAFRSFKWSLKKGFDLGDQIHNGWILANSDGDVHLRN